MTDLSLTPERSLADVPEPLREELVSAFNAVMTKHRKHDWEGAELSAGKFCEVVYTIIKGKAQGTYPAAATKPRNFPQACRDLENETALPRALRIQIPRVLPGIYEIRNNRNVGHVGGDVDPSHMDSTYVTATCRWVMADLVRTFHDLATKEATDVVEALIEREVPLVWQKGSVKRVLDPSIKHAKDKVLLLLETEPAAVDAEVLRGWIEYKHPHRFRDQILSELHTGRLVEFDTAADTVEILPPGSRRAATLLNGRK